MASTGTVIYGADYNTVQIKAEGILGSGSYYGGPSNGYGYGQSFSSSAVSPTAIITAAQWDNLVEDLNTSYKHQNGSDFAQYASVSSAIAPTNPITYQNLAILSDISTGIVSSRTAVNAGQITVTTGADQYITIEWGGGNVLGSTPASLYTESDFTSSGGTNGLHYFFNAGGSIRVYGIADTSIYTETDQENAWVAMMPNVGAVINYAQWQLLFASANNPVTLTTYSSSTTPYTGASSNLTATYISASSTIRIKMTYTDSHLPNPTDSEGPDSIRANLVGIRIDEWEPSGAFSIPITRSTTGSWTS